MTEPNSVNDIEMRSTFIGESRERIERLSQCALDIEAGRAADLASVLADLHGFKGTAAVAGLPDLSNACHRLEDVINALHGDESVFADRTELNELTAQTLLDFCDYANAYCDALASDVQPPHPPTFLSGDDLAFTGAKLKPFRTPHGIEGKMEGDTVCITVPSGVTAAELQGALSNFQQYIAATPRGITWRIDLSQVLIIDLPFAGELYVLQENLRERHGSMVLEGVRPSACTPSLLERLRRRFHVN